MKIVQIFIVLSFFLAAANCAAQSGTLKLTLPKLQFPAEKATLNQESKRVLGELAALMKSTPATSVEIGAHTDASGSAAYNLRLSQKRATAVRNYLIKKGVAGKRLQAKGYGESKPINRCRRGVRCSEAEKRQNRRVELKVKGLPTDSSARAAWLALGGSVSETSVRQAEAPKKSAGTLELADAGAIRSKTPTTGSVADENYFTDMADADQFVPKPLPNTFAGYAIEIACTERPLAAGVAMFRQFESVYLREEAGGPYCYYVGAFFTLPEARQFLREKTLPAYPKAQVVVFDGGAKKYLSPANDP